MRNSWFVFMLFISASQSGCGFLGVTGWGADLPDFFRLESHLSRKRFSGRVLSRFIKSLGCSDLGNTVAGVHKERMEP